MKVPRIDFLGIGAQKAATSWVWRNLRRHPDIWLPPRKELHYFDRSPQYDSASHLATSRLAARLTGRKPQDKRFRRQAVIEILSALKRADWVRLHWTLRYFGGTIDDVWYLSLFDSAKGRLTGEFTPSYSLLTAEDVGHIAALFPDLKIIFMLRNPIDRAWSQARFVWTRGHFDSMDDLDAIKGFIDSPSQSLRGDYLRTLGIWGSYFADEQMHVGYYDDVVRDPRGLLLQLFDFLEVPPGSYSFDSGFDERELASRELEMPAEIREYLAANYRSALVELSSRLGGHTSQWLEEANQALGGTVPDPTLSSSRSSATRR